MLSVESLTVRYGTALALDGVSVEVPDGTVVTLLGPNGAGKTTFVRAVCGLAAVAEGAVTYRGERIDGLDTAQVVRRGITLVPEGRHVFEAMSVRENLLLGGFTLDSASRQARVDEIWQLFPLLKERERQRAGTLSGGEQQMLAIGRALMSDPQLLLLDEPSLGLAPQLVRYLAELVREIAATGRALVLVEQNAKMALGVADFGYVLEHGQVRISGEAAEIALRPEVIETYLGGGTLR